MHFCRRFSTLFFTSNVNASLKGSDPSSKKSNRKNGSKPSVPNDEMSLSVLVSMFALQEQPSFVFHGKEGSRSHCLSAIPVTNVRQFAPQTIRPRQLVLSIQTISPHYVDELSGANFLGGELSRFPSDACASGAFMFINWEVIILSS